LIDETTSLADVAGAVANALREINHDPVVVGGSAATVHAPEAYRSHDIDMVVIGGVDEPQRLIAAMSQIGFSLAPGHYFMHGRSPYTVDFVPSPVAIAGDVITDFATVQTAYGNLRVLHVSDVVADRLNKYVVYDDADAFDVALSVARARSVSLKQLGVFIERQRARGAQSAAYAAAFERLKRRLGSQRRQLAP
jgi:hypothetical protein